MKSIYNKAICMILAAVMSIVPAVPAAAAETDTAKDDSLLIEDSTSDAAGSLAFTYKGEKIDGSELDIMIAPDQETDISPEAQQIGAVSNYDENKYTISVRLDGSDSSLTISDCIAEAVEYTASVTEKETGDVAETKTLTVNYSAEEEDASNSGSSEALIIEDETTSSDSGKTSLKTVRIMRAPKAQKAAAGVYIKQFSTQCFYGGTKNAAGTYVWDVPFTNKGYNSGHAFSFRINMALSGVGATPEGAVKITVPKTILKDRDGNMADSYEMSIPSEQEVEDASAGKGNAIDSDTEFAYYEDGDNLVIYNIKPLPSGYNGYIEMSYKTSESSFAYKDMGSQTPFTASIALNSDTTPNTASAAPLNVAINTAAKINSTGVRYPVRYKTWNKYWGTAPADADQYWYLEWDIVSDVSATQPYTFSLDNVINGLYNRTNNCPMDVAAIKFSGESYGSSTNVENQMVTGTRYDYVITRIPIKRAPYNTASSLDAANKTTASVVPKDLVDEATSKAGSNSWSWTRPVFSAPTGHVMTYKRADGAYRQYNPDGFSIYNYTNHYANSMSMKAREYSRYDLELFNGYDGTTKSLSAYDGLDYASWVVGYTYPWTRDASKATADHPENAYGHVPVTTVLEDEGVYLATEDTIKYTSDSRTKNTLNGDPLTSSDFWFKSVEFSWYMMDPEFDTEELSYSGKAAVYDGSDVLTFYAKFGSSDSWTQFGTYTIQGANSGTANFDSTYVASSDNNKIVFHDGIDCVAYKVVTSNKRYYTEIFTVPVIELKNSARVMNTLKDSSGNPSTTADIINNNTGKWYVGVGETGTKIAEIYASDVDYARVSKKESSIEKQVVSTYNNPKQRCYTITWKADMEETVTSGENGDVNYIEQDSGTYYDLLPEGAVFDPDSVQVQDEYTKKNITSYTVSSVDNYNGTGRTMVVIHINSIGKQYAVWFDTIHAWNSIKDYGNDVYNPIAYKTGNSSIYQGFADNGGQCFHDGSKNAKAIKDAALMASLDDDSANDADDSAGQFIYAETQWDISAITAASAGLTKKVKAEDETKYTYDSTTTLNGKYSYQLRYMNTFTNTAKDLILFDSLENYYKTGTGDATAAGKSDWKGALQSIDVSQIKEAGADPIVYVYTGNDDLSIDEHHDLADSDVWTRLDQLTDLGSMNIKAVAIDLRKTSDGSEFILAPGRSVSAYLYMKAPNASADSQKGKAYAYAYNNIYISNTLIGDTGSSQSFFIHQDYTKIKLIITQDLYFKKISAKDGSAVPNITYRVSGTSDYGTVTDMQVSTDTNGEGKFSKIEKGTYVLQEYKTNDDWLLDTTEHTLVVDGTGKITVDGVDYTNEEGSSDKRYIFKETPRVHADLSFRKQSLSVDSNGNRFNISGARFKLSGTSDYGTKTTQFATSDAGRVQFSNIEKGTYDLTEASSPDSFVLSDRVFKVVVEDTGAGPKGTADIVGQWNSDRTKILAPYTDKAAKYTDDMAADYTEWMSRTNNGTAVLYNEDRYFDFALKKYEKTTNGTSLICDNTDSSGNVYRVTTPAKFELSGTSDLGTYVDETFAMDSNGYVSFTKNGHAILEKGSYILKETQAPIVTKTTQDGTDTELNYIQDLSSYVVTIDYHGNVSIVNASDTSQVLEKANGGTDDTQTFVFVNDRAETGIITVTKVWDDSDPAGRKLPKLHISTVDPKNPKYTLTFNPDGGTWSDSTTANKMIAMKGSSAANDSGKSTLLLIAQTDAVSKTGYTFDGWYNGSEKYNVVKDDSGNVTVAKASDNSSPTEDITLTAKWKPPVLTTGGKFNIAIKKLAGNSNPGYMTPDSNITTVKLTTTAPGNGITTEDVSADQNGAVKAWFDNGTIYLYASGGSELALNADSSAMFYYCRGLTSLDLSNWNTGSVTDMNGMFYGCSSLTSLDVSKWDTGSVTDMGYMFNGCSGLTSLDVISNWDTSKVTNMRAMFQNCRSLTSLDLSNWNTGSVTNMSYMFYHCSSLTSLDVSNWNTGSVKDMSGMFSGCSILHTIYVGSKWNVDKVAKYSNMFMFDIKLVGGAGTKYDASHIDKAYAHIDGGTSNPGYLTAK